MTTAEILNAAADLIEPDGAWEQGCLALDGDGNPESPNSPRARCWCGAGAIWRIALASDYMDALMVFQRTQGMHLMSFNDAPGRTQAEVVRALRDAAKAAS